MPITPAEIIKTARKKSGLNQSELAMLIGKSRSVVAKYEKGEIDPPSSILLKVQSLVNVNDNGKKHAQ